MHSVSDMLAVEILSLVKVETRRLALAGARGAGIVAIRLHEITSDITADQIEVLARDICAMTMIRRTIFI